MLQIAPAPDSSATLQRGLSYVAKGAGETAGARGSFQFTFADDGRFVLIVESPLPERVGFDGRETWSTDWSDLPRVLSLGEEQAERLGISAWMGMLPDSATVDPRLHTEIELED